MRFFTCFKVFLAKKKGNQCLRLIGIHRIQTFQPLLSKCFLIFPNLSTFSFKSFKQILNNLIVSDNHSLSHHEGTQKSCKRNPNTEDVLWWKTLLYRLVKAIKFRNPTSALLCPAEICSSSLTKKLFIQASRQFATQFMVISCFGPFESSWYWIENISGGLKCVIKLSGDLALSTCAGLNYSLILTMLS